MARASSRRGGRPRSNARARGREPQRVAPAPAPKKAASYEDQLFFMRLRRHQKWLFAFLALAFFLGFVVLGIGSGNGFLVDAFQSIGGGGSSSIESVNDAQKRVDENPGDADALLSLANALQAAARPDEAIAVLEEYVKLRPDEADGLHQLAALYDLQVSEASTRASALAAEAEGGALSTTISLFPASSGFLGAAGEDPIAEALNSSLASEAQKATDEVTQLLEQQVPIYEALVRLTPGEPLLQLQLGQAALGAENEEVAIAAFEKFLELAPDDPAAPVVRGYLVELGVPQDSIEDTQDSATG